MAILADISFRRAIMLLVIAVIVLTAGTTVTVKLTTDRLINDDARGDAGDWAQFIAANVPDLKQIAAGELPNASSMAFLEATRRYGQVFRFAIYNRQGYSQLVGDREKIGAVGLSELSAEAAQAIATGKTIIDISNGKTAGLPEHFARAFVPIIVNGEPIAVVAAYVDESKAHSQHFSDIIEAAVVLCLITSLAFGVPAIGWYLRTQEKRQADRRIQFLAHHDALTGLANRTRLIERLDSALAMLPETGGHIAVHFLDIDRFKDVNDTLGHAGGDFLLSTLGQRLSALSRIEDMVARLGGDEFVVVQTGVAGKEQAEDFARRIVSMLSEPMSFKEQEIRVNVTVGVAMAPVDGEIAEHLLKHADLALYSGKAAGRNRICFFTLEMDKALQVHLVLEKAIRNATLNDGFVLHYQPVFKIGSGRLVGFEALLRLPAPDGTLIPPAEIIPVAEDMHLIDKIGALVLREACRTAAAWPKELTIAVNLSPSQFESETIVEVVTSALKASGLDANRLELEITEVLLLGNSESTMKQLRELKALGVSIVMDDFGTGYSSLNYLWKFPFDKIKVDRSFMQDFDKSGRDVETVVKSIIALGRELRMRVTVEGVETLKQADFLTGADADQVQGFYFGRPVPASELGATVLADFRNSLPTTSPPGKAKFQLQKNVG
jgi:diguanylate cyclase (GGDEF)-like protein